MRRRANTPTERELRLVSYPQSSDGSEEEEGKNEGKRSSLWKDLRELDLSEAFRSRAITSLGSWWRNLHELDLSEAFLPSLLRRDLLRGRGNPLQDIGDSMPNLRYLIDSMPNLRDMVDSMPNLRYLTFPDRFVGVPGIRNGYNGYMAFDGEDALTEFTTDTLGRMLPESQTSFDHLPPFLLHHEENPVSIHSERFDELENEIVELRRDEVDTENDEEDITELLPRHEHRIFIAHIVDIQRPEIHGNILKVYLKWFYVIINPLLEILALVFDQLSSPSKSGFALAGLLISLVVAVACVSEFGLKVRRREITWRQRGWIDFCEVLFAICQVISSTIQFVYFHQHAENPFKISIIPVIFAIFVALSKSIKIPNDRANEGHSLVDHGEEVLPVRVN